MANLNLDWFPKEVMPKPSGYYANIILLRVTDSYALFQTDGELNTARVRAGEKASEVITRIEMFKRKQTTPERLRGRELLRHYGLLSPLPADKGAQGAGAPICDYNVAFCTTCPDCITYGFAIGDAGSEKSKVIADTAYSITPYESSHETRTLNAPYESGTMSREGQVTSRINEQDHVRPGVIFPAVVSVHDVTASLFQYVLSNVLSTGHYGAQTTRTGRMTNHPVAIALTDGEIFSNLKFTQRLYDALQDVSAITPPDPVDIQVAVDKARLLVPELLREDGVAVHQLILGPDLHGLLAGLRPVGADHTAQLLKAAFTDSQAYYGRWVAKTKK